MKTLNDLYEKYGTLIQGAADKYDLDECLVGALIWQESRGNPKAVSPCGAKGLGQFMDATAKQMGVKDAFNPEDAIYGVAKYLRWLKTNYSHDSITKTLAAYNAGPGRLKGDQWQRIPETSNYVVKVLQYSKEYRLMREAKKQIEKSA